MYRLYWLPLVVAVMLLAFGPMIADYMACTSHAEFSYDWTPFPHCNFHFDELFK